MKRRYRAEDRGQHPETGNLLRRDAVFDADFGRKEPRWVTPVPSDTPLSDGLSEDGVTWSSEADRKRAERQRAERASGVFWYSSGPVFR